MEEGYFKRKNLINIRPMPYDFRGLEKTDIKEMHQAFLLAFADYQLPFRLSYEQFIQKFILKLNIDYPLSVGIFDDKKLVAFIFTSVGEYRGLKTAYNGGTGVIPGHRSKGLTIQMYEYLWPKFKQENITQAVLEVLTENEQAIKSYRSCGFSIYTTYHCFSITSDSLRKGSSVPEGFLIEKATQADWALYRRFHDTETYFLDSIPMLKHHLSDEYLAEAKIGDRVVGYVIFQPQVSRISRLAVDKDFRGRGIGKELISYSLQLSNSHPVTILNIDYKETELISLLRHLGFRQTVDQYEMVRKI